MKKYIYVAVCILLSAAIATMPVSAEQGRGSGGESGSSGTSMTPERSETSRGERSSNRSDGSGDRSTTDIRRDDNSTLSQERSRKTETEASDDSRQRIVDEMRIKREERRSDKLDGARKELCENRESVIDRRMKSVEDRASKRLSFMDSVVERTKEFYASKELSVSNYDELLTTVSVARVAAVNATTTLEASRPPAFTCDSDNPKNDVTMFRDAIKPQHDALRAYRDAIKSLIRAVHSAAQTDTSDAAARQGADQ